MPIVLKVTCDGCGAEKKSENHWWVITPGALVFTIRIFDGQAPDGDFVLCGEPCVHKKTSEWMGARTKR